MTITREQVMRWHEEGGIWTSECGSYLIHTAYNREGEPTAYILFHADPGSELWHRLHVSFRMAKRAAYSLRGRTLTDVDRSEALAIMAARYTLTDNQVILSQEEMMSLYHTGRELDAKGQGWWLFIYENEALAKLAKEQWELNGYETGELAFFSGQEAGHGFDDPPDWSLEVNVNRKEA